MKRFSFKEFFGKFRKPEPTPQKVRKTIVLSPGVQAQILAKAKEEKALADLAKKQQAEIAKMTDAEKKERYFVTPAGAQPRNYVASLQGKAFAQKNEQLMQMRQRVLTEFGFEGEQLQNILRYFRVRKAANILAHTRYASEVAAKELLRFLRVEKNKFAADKDQMTLFDFHIPNLEGQIKSAPVPSSFYDNPLNEVAIGEIENANLALRPTEIPGTRIIFGNPVTFIFAFNKAEQAIKRELGDKHPEFFERIRAERKKI